MRYNIEVIDDFIFVKIFCHRPQTCVCGHFFDRRYNMAHRPNKTGRGGKDNPHYYNGKVLKETRKKQGLTQEQVGKKVGGKSKHGAMSKSALSQIESGKVLPTLKTAKKISQVVGVTLDDLTKHK